MPRTPSTNFTSEKNKPVNAPLFLYRIDMETGSAANDIYLAEWDEDITYFRDVSTSQVYSAYPIQHEGISSQSGGQIDTLQVTVANVSREIVALLEGSQVIGGATVDNDGLRGHKVTIRQVFADQLADAAAYIEDIFYIESADYNEMTAIFYLSTRLSILDVSLPGRRCTHNHCSWKYKGFGCWSGSVAPYTKPATFNETHTIMSYDLVDQDFPSFGPYAEYGTLKTIVNTYAAFAPLSCFGMTRTGLDELVVELKIDHYAHITHPDDSGYLYLASDLGNHAAINTADPGDYWWVKVPYASITGAWQTFTFLLSDFSAVGSLDINHVMGVGWQEVVGSLGGDSTPVLHIRNPQMLLTQAAAWNKGTQDACDRTLENCRIHNNTLRYGAFPGVPSRRVFRVG